MTTSSITIPAGLAATLSLPDLSLADGTPAAESVTAIGGGLLRRSLRMTMPLDRDSAAAAHRTERLSRIREHVIRPVRVLAVLAVLTGAVVVFAMDDPPRTLTMWTLVAILVTALAEWVLQELIVRSALLQHPRREKNGIKLSYVPEPVAQEIVHRNPGTILSR
jgi:hypothetical protein